MMPARTHGFTTGRRGTLRLHHPAYARWVNAKQRCNNPRHPRYKDWGGRRTYLCPRGIWFAPEWNDFAKFITDMGDPPGRRYDLYSLDRINNDGPYAPGNVRWSTQAQQRNNQYRAPWPFGVLDYEKDGWSDDVDDILRHYDRTTASDPEFQEALAARDWERAIDRAEQLVSAREAAASFHSGAAVLYGA